MTKAKTDQATDSAADGIERPELRMRRCVPPTRTTLVWFLWGVGVFVSLAVVIALQESPTEAVACHPLYGCESTTTTARPTCPPPHGCPTTTRPATTTTARPTTTTRATTTTTTTRPTTTTARPTTTTTVPTTTTTTRCPPPNGCTPTTQPTTTIQPTTTTTRPTTTTTRRPRPPRPTRATTTTARPTTTTTVPTTTTTTRCPPPNGCTPTTQPTTTIQRTTTTTRPTTTTTTEPCNPVSGNPHAGCATTTTVSNTTSPTTTITVRECAPPTGEGCPERTDPPVTTLRECAPPTGEGCPESRPTTSTTQDTTTTTEGTTTTQDTTTTTEGTTTTQDTTTTTEGTTTTQDTTTTTEGTTTTQDTTTTTEGTTTTIITEPETDCTLYIRPEYIGFAHKEDAGGYVYSYNLYLGYRCNGPFVVGHPSIRLVPESTTHIPRMNLRYSEHEPVIENVPVATELDQLSCLPINLFNHPLCLSHTPSFYRIEMGPFLIGYTSVTRLQPLQDVCKKFPGGVVSAGLSSVNEIKAFSKTTSFCLDIDPGASTPGNLLIDDYLDHWLFPISKPAAVQGLTVSMNSDLWLVTWSPPPTGGPVSSYRVDVGVSGYSTSFRVQGTQADISDYVDGRIGQQFGVKVWAENTAGRSEYVYKAFTASPTGPTAPTSPIVSTPTTTTVPTTTSPTTTTAPAEQPAKPGTVSGLAATASNGSVTLRWTAPTDGGPVTGYRIVRAVKNPATGQLSFATVDVDSTATSYTDTSPVRGESHNYIVQALNGNKAGTAAQVSITPPTATTTTTTTRTTTTAP